jgi:hypothetical protein
MYRTKSTTFKELKIKQAPVEAKMEAGANAHQEVFAVNKRVKNVINPQPKPKAKTPTPIRCTNGEPVSMLKAT